MVVTAKGYRIDICHSDADKVGYIIMPMPPTTEDLEEMERLAREYAINLIVLSGVNWNKDMTPWPASGIRPRKGNFDGGAEDFLQTLLNEVIPSIEGKQMEYVGTRILIGLSLSGLFALWAGCHTDAFAMVASVSGSLWYDGFTEWLSGQSPAYRHAFLLLGDKEKKTRNPRMAVVEERTRTACDILHQKGVKVVFHLDCGTHFSPFFPRLEMTLRWMNDIVST